MSLVTAAVLACSLLAAQEGLDPPQDDEAPGTLRAAPQAAEEDGDQGGSNPLLGPLVVGAAVVGTGVFGTLITSVASAGWGAAVVFACGCPGNAALLGAGAMVGALVADVLFGAVDPVRMVLAGGLAAMMGLGGTTFTAVIALVVAVVTNLVLSRYGVAEINPTEVVSGTFSDAFILRSVVGGAVMAPVVFVFVGSTTLLAAVAASAGYGIHTALE